ncbi:MAG: hypothetical protein ACRDL8_03825, partial [Solirubrobacteraceae bacterium]
MNVRVLHGDEELAAAQALAAQSARRLHDRLAVRAARDAWVAEHAEQRVGWLRFAGVPPEGAHEVIAAAQGEREPSPQESATSQPASRTSSRRVPRPW